MFLFHLDCQTIGTLSWIQDQHVGRFLRTQVLEYELAQKNAVQIKARFSIVQELNKSCFSFLCLLIYFSFLFRFIEIRSGFKYAYIHLFFSALV